jgi:hypothetical protein
VRSCAAKKGNVRALWEVSQKQEIMKSNPDPKNETSQKYQTSLPSAGKENVRDIISKSFKSIINRSLVGGHKSFQL